LRDLSEAFQPGDRLKALITEVDGQRGRIALNTALLENQPGELLIAKEQLMQEAPERAVRARSLLQQREQQKQQEHVSSAPPEPESLTESAPAQAPMSPS
ncbi:MAG: hypothetical protein ACK559_16925, partial [bacterium]